MYSIYIMHRISALYITRHALCMYLVIQFTNLRKIFNYSICQSKEKTRYFFSTTGKKTIQYFWSSPESKAADVLAAQTGEALLGKFLQVVGSLIIDHHSQNEAVRHFIHIVCKAPTLILTAVCVKPEDAKVKLLFWRLKKQTGTSTSSDQII